MGPSRIKTKLWVALGLDLQPTFVCLYCKQMGKMEFKDFYRVLRKVSPNFRPRNEFLAQNNLFSRAERFPAKVPKLHLHALSRGFNLYK